MRIVDLAPPFRMEDWFNARILIDLAVDHRTIRTKTKILWVFHPDDEPGFVNTCRVSLNDDLPFEFATAYRRTIFLQLDTGMWFAMKPPKHWHEFPREQQLISVARSDRRKNSHKSAPQ